MLMARIMAAVAAVYGAFAKVAAPADLEPGNQLLGLARLAFRAFALIGIDVICSKL
jgi:hypothetical protein